ncbi:ABC transporter permease [Rudaeicoccus suwonensis]|uniref:Putative ABC transport system permease protein n=1 Tax=Rudaeicoccus suwonensis TaxID=657409 RepID=A0A561E3D6_9MICO|nr:ABC transporter permease [Rudaeicoccus suwonensis]TWE10109.1 putative ABC transport system permease protein [Rudaeicoccus suwonensis]
MSWGETFRTALEAIGHRRMRSVLTVLGILIGIAAVMLTVGLGQGAQSKVAKQIDALGTNLLVVSPGSTTSTTGVRSARGSATTLTTTDADILANPVVAPDISGVAPTSTATDSLVNGSTNWSTSVVGTTPSWLTVRARTMSEGRFISTSDINAASPVMVLGSTTAEELFGARDPVGQTVTVDGQTFSIIGELATAGSSGTTDEDDQAIVPMTTFAQRLSTSTDTQSVSDIYLEAKSSSDLSAAYQEATAALLTSHDVTTATEDFTVSSQASLVATATSTTHTLTVLLGGIAAISLLVGGIGVMNIMLVSVTERIREIGLRKALGATPRTILKQFLTEASVLGLAGGIVGISLGAVGALILPHFLNQPVDISAEAAGFALVVSVLIGVAAGVYPASRAAKLAPIDALRNE